MKNKDLTVGKASSVIWKFCLPLFASVIFQQLYNISDSFVAGRFIGENALAAVGNSYEITLIFIAFALGCNIGCSVVVSKLFGEKRYTDLKSAVYTTIISTAAVCGLLMLIGLTLGKYLLKAIHTPDEIMDASRQYLNIYLFSLPFVFFYNVSTGIFSALGDAITPFIFLTISSCANVGIDILFVKECGLGVSGVAWATFLCQGVSCILAVIVVMFRLKKIKTDEKTKLFDKKLFKEISSIAIPTILQQSFISVGNIIIQGSINSFGPSVIAGYSGAIKLNNLVITSFNTLGNGISNFTAQNIGANKRARVKEGFKAGMALVWILAAIIVVLYQSAGQYLLRIFIEDPQSKAMETGMQFLRIVSPFYFVIALKVISDGVLRGSKHMGKFMLATFTDLSLRVILSITLCKTSLGPLGIWISWPIGWTIASAMAFLFYKKNRWINDTPYVRQPNKITQATSE